MNKITDILLDKLKEDNVAYKNLETRSLGIKEKKKVIRSLMNIRMPGHLSNWFLSIQDIYLQNELENKGIVSLDDIPVVEQQYNSKIPHADKISIWQGDITRLRTGAIVNAANSQMLGCFVPCHACIDNAIHSAAGLQLREECNNIMERKRQQNGRQYQEQTGTAVLTKAYNLPCSYVIHTVGPIVYNGLDQKLCQDLCNCYRSVLECCVTNEIKSVAFCCISTGEFHFPNDKAAEIALETVLSFLDIHSNFFDRIVFNVFKDIDREIYENLIIKG
ncbi:MAG: protein-ADP-ribose hydrolase [Lachnospiraceae bacterium]|nr:protein-ADP-ribose hydrolase [Lachnospiraceae bacterium]